MPETRVSGPCSLRASRPHPLGRGARVPRRKTSRRGRIALASRAKRRHKKRNGRAIVIVVLILIPWLTVVTMIISICRVAARADTAELESYRRWLAVGIRRDASGDARYPNGQRTPASTSAGCARTDVGSQLRCRRSCFWRCGSPARRSRRDSACEPSSACGKRL